MNEPTSDIGWLVSRVWRAFKSSEWTQAVVILVGSFAFLFVIPEVAGEAGLIVVDVGIVIAALYLFVLYVAKTERHIAERPSSYLRPDRWSYLWVALGIAVVAVILIGTRGFPIIQ